jgi:hypothetical protein
VGDVDVGYSVFVCTAVAVSVVCVCVRAFGIAGHVCPR